MPYTAGFMGPERWPELDWAFLGAHHALQKSVFDKYVPPAAYQSFEAWRDATQAYQATLVRSQVETLRRLKYRPTGGFAVFCLNDAQPAVSWSLLDHERVPKLAYGVLGDACAPVIVVGRLAQLPNYRPGGPISVEVHVVNDLREPLAGASVEARLCIWPGGGRLLAVRGRRRRRTPASTSGGFATSPCPAARRRRGECLRGRLARPGPPLGGPVRPMLGARTVTAAWR